MAKSYTTVFMAFVATFVVLQFLFSTLSRTIVPPVVVSLPVVQYVCSRSGIEYLVVDHVPILHVDQQGLPIICQDPSNLAKD